MFENFYIVILLSGLIGILARYNLIDSFREHEVSTEEFKIEVLAMGLFYILSNSTFFIFDLPIVNLLIQIFSLGAIGRIMKLETKKILQAVSFTIIVLVSIESSVVFATGYVSKGIIFEAQYNSIYGIVASNLIAYAVSVGIRKHKNIRKNIDVSLIYWSVITVFPIASLILLLNIFKFSIYNTNIVAIGTTMVLIMNLMMFSLYDRLVLMYEIKIKAAMTHQMNISYKNQLKLMKWSQFQLKSFQHDINKHISIMDSLVNKKHYDELEEYINAIKTRNPKDSFLSNTGNAVIDSIINFEVSNSTLSQENIAFGFKDVPAVIAIEDYDITVVLSNVLQNALFAAGKIENGKVDINIYFIKGVLYISIENSFDGKYIYKDGGYQTTSSEKGNHGLGFSNVQSVIAKYDGKIDIRQNDRKFYVDVILYSKTDNY